MEVLFFLGLFLFICWLGYEFFIKLKNNNHLDDSDFGSGILEAIIIGMVIASVLGIFGPRK